MRQWIEAIPIYLDQNFPRPGQINIHLLSWGFGSLTSAYSHCSYLALGNSVGRRTHFEVSNSLDGFHESQSQVLFCSHYIKWLCCPPILLAILYLRDNNRLDHRRTASLCMRTRYPTDARCDCSESHKAKDCLYCLSVSIRPMFSLTKRSGKLNVNFQRIEFNTQRSPLCRYRYGSTS
jgi:hypothetical protein